MAAIGWIVEGVEPGHRHFKKASRVLGGRVQNCTLQRAQFSSPFDVVTLWDVLEHVPEPQQFLSCCRALLRLGGCLFLNVPDLESKEARLLGRHWPLLLPEHLNYFTRKSLGLCAGPAGFRVLRFTRRRAIFSLQYVAYRVAQHDLPGSGFLRILGRGPMGRISIPVSLGETLAILQAA